MHLLTEHLKRVNNLCRLCGERVKRKEKDSYKNIKLCANYVHELSLYRNINFAEDEDGKHPKGMCSRCYTKLMDCKRLKYESMNNGSCQHAARQRESSSAQWTHFDSSMLLHQCSSCSHYENQCKGGRPRKSLVGAVKRKVPAVNSFSTDVESNTSTDLHPVLPSTPVQKKN